MLGRIDVANIPERQGQLLRQALQARLPSDQAGVPPDYQLQTVYAIQTEGLAITTESAVTRLRLIATASFVLQSLQGTPRTCASGNVRAVDGLDVENQQFFASDLETETVQHRLAQAVANQIVTKLALAFSAKGGFACEAR